MTILKNQLSIDMGEHTEMFSQFILKAEHDADMRGFRITFERDFRELITVNERNIDSWYPLTTTFHPDFCDLSDAFWLAARDKEDRVIATYVNRLFNWSATDLWTEFDSLRLFYDAPDRAPRHEACGIPPAIRASVKLNGRLCYSGGAWVHPNHHGAFLPGILSVISCAAAVSALRADICFGFTGEHPERPGYYYDYGCPHIAGPLYLIGSRIGGHKTMALLWRHAQDVIALVRAKGRTRTRLRQL